MADGCEIPPTSSELSPIFVNSTLPRFVADMPKTLDEALRADPPCYPRACAIQACLQKSNYNESRCAHLIDALYECCAELYERGGPGERSACCPKKNLLTLKMKQRAGNKDAGGPGGADTGGADTRRG